MNEIISRIYNSDKEISRYFTLKPYVLKGKEFIYLQLRPDGQETDLENIIVPLDSTLAAIEENGIYNIVFSFKMIEFIDLSYSIIISHLQRIEKNGGTIIFCDVHPKIMDVWRILGFDKTVNVYASEKEMLEKE